MRIGGIALTDLTKTLSLKMMLFPDVFIRMRRTMIITRTKCFSKVREIENGNLAKCTRHVDRVIHNLVEEKKNKDTKFGCGTTAGV